MTDRELLECAARAAGLLERAIIYEEEDGTGFYAKIGKREYWRPLQDDADAFRLAVKLNLQIIIEDERCGCVTASWGEDYQNHAVEHSETPETAAAATRRAIVRAAAAIGERVGVPQTAGN